MFDSPVSRFSTQAARTGVTELYFVAAPMAQRHVRDGQGLAYCGVLCVSDDNVCGACVVKNGHPVLCHEASACQAAASSATMAHADVSMTAENSCRLAERDI